ncbi:MAG: hypothetical protein DHS20C21_07400 [Gemmatimonadota bacterium]|nr:MAG: hypothetical protein DHS20C21_07400 [Gemmatimonadota bacterium]
MARASRLTLICLAILWTALPALALEKAELPMTDDRGWGGWDAGTTCSVSYYNDCTGWVWVWGGWADEDVLGMTYDPCCDGAALEATTTYVWTGASCPGYGYTGTIEVSSVDSNGCPTTILAQTSFFPTSGANVHIWDVPALGPIVLTMTVASTGYCGGNAVILPSDHPAAGPTGPAACGFCYPTDRVTHSFYYGNNGTGRSCPGQPLFDGVCNAEWLMWSASFTCPVSIEGSSWGTIKNLYR